MINDWFDFTEFLVTLIRAKFGIVGKVKEL